MSLLFRCRRCRKYRVLSLKGLCSECRNPPPPLPMGESRQPAQTEPREVVVPNVVDMSEDAARETIQQGGDLKASVKKEVSDKVEKEKVINQQPPPPPIGGPPAAPPSGGPPAPPPPPDGIKVLGKKDKKDKANMEKNKSSLVLRDQINEFIQQLADLENPDLGFPVFSVCDCNSFHTSGYLWGLYAAKKLKKLDKMPVAPIAIVNFDQHDDMGKSKGDCVASDRWGLPLVNSLGKLGYERACYLSVLNGGAKTPPSPACKAFFHAAGGTEKCPSIDLKGKTYEKRFNEATFREFWGRVKEYFGAKIGYVFVSVDRDCLENNFTQWGDGGVPDVAALKKVMSAVLAPLLGSRPIDEIDLRKSSSNKKDTKTTARLIGFDVTGLPEHQGVLIKYRPKLLRDNSKTNEVLETDATLKDYADRNGLTVEKVIKLNPGLKEAHEFGKKMSEWPLTLGYRIEFNDMCTAAWERVKLDDLFKFAEGQSIPATRSWSRVIFFSGSVGFGSTTNEFLAAIDDTKECDCWDFLLNLNKHLPKLLDGSWNYVVCGQKGPIYKEGWKPFAVFSPARKVGKWVDRQAVKKFFGKPKAKPGGFACSASLTDPDTVTKLNGTKQISIGDMKSKKGAFKEVDFPTNTEKE